MTHGIGFLPQCDQIIVMDGGRITEAGAYAELIDADGDFAEFIRTFTAMDENEEGDPSTYIYIHETYNHTHYTHLCLSCILIQRSVSIQNLSKSYLETQPLIPAPVWHTTVSMRMMKPGHADRPGGDTSVLH